MKRPHLLNYGFAYLALIAVTTLLTNHAAAQDADVPTCTIIGQAVLPDEVP